ncbi:coiled-coil domain-containing protein 168 [Cebus imitator]|uniref:coiled-coil domain-containing protein 168 n=1 Tax=Cebus imitator TaxID=2715852 RepID=UPI001899782D|nr:coiled-coil domain-containing protein 168 [Cebus imitator]
MSKQYYSFKKEVAGELEDNTFLTLWDFLESWIIQNDWMAIFFIIFLGIIFEIIFMKTCAYFWKNPTLPEEGSSDVQEREDSCLKSMAFAPENSSVINSSSEERVGTFSEKRVTSLLTSEEKECDFEDRILLSHEIIRSGTSESEDQVSHSSESHMPSSNGISSSLSLFNSEVEKMCLSHTEHPMNMKQYNEYETIQHEYETIQFSSKKLFSMMKTNKNKNSEFSSDLSFSASRFTVENEDLDVAPCPPAHLFLSRDQVRLLEENVRNQIPSKPKAKLESKTTYQCSRSQQSLNQNQPYVGMVISVQAQDSFPGQNTIQNQGLYEVQFTSINHNQELINSQPDIKASGFAQPQDGMTKPFCSSAQDSFQSQDLERNQHFVEVPSVVEAQYSVKSLGSDEHFGEDQHSVWLINSNKIKYSTKRQDIIFKNAGFLVLTLNPNLVAEDIPHLRTVKPEGQQQIVSSEFNKDSVYSSVPLSSTIKGQKNRRKTPDSKNKLSLNIPSLKAKKPPTSQVFQITACHTLKNRNELGCKNNTDKKELHERKDISDVALHLISVSKLILPYIKNYSRKQLVKFMPGLIKCGHFLQRKNKSPATEKINYTGAAEKTGILGATKKEKECDKENKGLKNISPKMLPQLEESFMVNTDQLKAPCLLVETNGKSKESLKDPVTQAKEIAITELHAPNSRKPFDLHILKHKTSLEDAISKPTQKLISSPKWETNNRMKIQEVLQSSENSHRQLSNGEDLPTSTPKMQRCFPRENTQKQQDFLQLVLELSNVHLLISLGSNMHKSSEELKAVKIQVSTESVNLKENEPLMLNVTDDLSESEALECNARNNVTNMHQDKEMSDAFHSAAYTTISELSDTEIDSRLKAKADTLRRIRVSHSVSKHEKLPDEKETQNAEYIDKSSTFKKSQQCDRKEEEKEANSELPQDFRFSMHLKQRPKYIKFEMEQISSGSSKAPNKEQEVQPQTLSTQTILETSPCPMMDPFQVEKVKQSTDRPTDRKSAADTKNPLTMPENLAVGELSVETTEYSVPFGGNLRKTMDGHTVEEKEDIKRDLPAVALGSFDIRLLTLSHLKRQKIKKTLSETKNVLSVKYVIMKVKKPAISLMPYINIYGTPNHRKKMGGNFEIIIKQILQDKIVAGVLLNVINPHLSILPNTRMHSGLNAENHSYIKVVQEESQIGREEKCPAFINKGNESQNALEAKLQDEVKRIKETLPKVALHDSWSLGLDAHLAKEIKTEKEMHQPIPFTETTMESVVSPIMQSSHVENVKSSQTTETDCKCTADSEMPPPISGKSLIGHFLNQTRESDVPSNGSDTREMGYCFARKKTEIPKNLPAASPETYNCCTPVLSSSKVMKKRVTFALTTSTVKSKCLNAKDVKPSVSETVSVTSHRKKSELDFKFKKINQAKGLVPEYPNVLFSPMHSRLQRDFCLSVSQLKQGEPAVKTYTDVFAKSSVFHDREEKSQDREEEEQKASLEAVPQLSQHLGSHACQMKEIHLESHPALNYLTLEQCVNGKSLQHQTDFKQTTLKTSLQMGPLEAEEVQKTNKTKNDIIALVGPKIPPPKALQAPENSHGFILNAHQRDHELVKSDDGRNQPGNANIQVQPQTHFTQTILESSSGPTVDQFQFEKVESYVRFSPLNSGEAKVDEIISYAREGGISSDSSLQKEQPGGSEKKETVIFDSCMSALSTPKRKRNLKQFSDMKTLVNPKCGIMKAKKPSISYMLNIKASAGPNHRKELSCNLTTKMKEVHQGKKGADKTYAFLTMTPDINTYGKVETEKDTLREERLGCIRVKQDTSPNEDSITSDNIKETCLQDEEQEERKQEALLKVIPQHVQHFIFRSGQREDLDFHKLENQGSRKILFVTKQDVPQQLHSAEPIQGVETNKCLQTQNGTICTVNANLPLKSEDSLNGEVLIGAIKHGVPTDRKCRGEQHDSGKGEKVEFHRDLRATVLELQISPHGGEAEKANLTDMESGSNVAINMNVQHEREDKNIQKMLSDSVPCHSQHLSFSAHQMKDPDPCKLGSELKSPEDRSSWNLSHIAQKTKQETHFRETVLEPISRYMMKQSPHMQEGIKCMVGPKTSFPKTGKSEIGSIPFDTPLDENPRRKWNSSISEKTAWNQKNLRTVLKPFDFSSLVSSEYESQSYTLEFMGKKSIMSPKRVTLKAKQLPISRLFKIIRYPTENHGKKKQHHFKYRMKGRQWYTSIGEALLSATEYAKSLPSKAVIDKLLFNTAVRGILSNRTHRQNLDGLIAGEKEEVQENVAETFLGPLDFLMPVLSNPKNQMNTVHLSEKEIILNSKYLPMKEKKSLVSQIHKINKQSATKHRKKLKSYLKTLSNRTLQENHGHITDEKEKVQENLAATFLGSLDFFMHVLSDSKNQINIVQLSERKIILNHKCLTLKKKKPPISQIHKISRQFTAKYRKKLESNLKTKLKATWQGGNVADTFPNTIFFTPDTTNIKKPSRFQTEIDMRISGLSHTHPTQIESPAEVITRYSDSIDKRGTSNLLKGAKLHGRESGEEKQEHLTEMGPFCAENFMANTYLTKDPHPGKSEDVLLGEIFFSQSQIYQGNLEKNVKMEKNKNGKGSLKVGLPRKEKSDNCAELSEPTDDAISNKYGKENIGYSVLKEKAFCNLAGIVPGSVGRHLPASEEMKRQNDSLQTADRPSPEGRPLQAKQSAVPQSFDAAGHAVLTIHKEEKQKLKAQKTEKTEVDLMDQEAKINVAEEFNPESVVFPKIHLLQIESKKEFKIEDWKTRADPKTLALQKKQQEPCVSGTTWSSPNPYTSIYPTTIRHKDKAKTANVESTLHTKQVKLKAKRIPVSQLLEYGTAGNQKETRGNIQQQKKNAVHRVLKAVYDSGYFVSSIKKLTEVKMEKNKPKDRACILPQLKLEKPLKEMQRSLSGCTDMSGILRKQEQDIREKEQKHQSILEDTSQYCIEPLRISSQHSNYSSFDAPRIRKDGELEFPVAQRAKEKDIGMAKHSVSVPVPWESEGSKGLDIPLNSKGQNVLFTELDTSQQICQQQELLKHEDISMTNLESMACPIMEPLHLENTGKIAEEEDVYINRKNIPHVLGREGLMETDILIGSKGQNFFCTNPEGQHEVPMVQEGQVNPDYVPESILDSVSFPNKDPLHLKQTEKTKKENVSISESFNENPWGREQSKLTNITLKSNRQKMDFSKKLRAKQLSNCYQNKENTLESIFPYTLHQLHIENPKKEGSAEEIMSSKVLSPMIEKASHKVGIPVDQPPCSEGIHLNIKGRKEHPQESTHKAFPASVSHSLMDIHEIKSPKVKKADSSGCHISNTKEIGLLFTGQSEQEEKCTYEALLKSAPHSKTDLHRFNASMQEEKLDAMNILHYDHLTSQAREAVKQMDVIVGYTQNSKKGQALLKTGQKWQCPPISHENFWEHISYPQKHPYVLQHLMPQEKEAISEGGNVSSRTPGLDLFSEDQISTETKDGLEGIVPFVTPRQMNKQDTMLPLGSYRKTMKYPSLLFPKGMKSSEGVQVFDLISNNSSPKLRFGKKIESHKANQKVQKEVCLPVILHPLSVSMPILPESKGQKDSIKQVIRKGVIYHKRRTPKLKKSVFSHILNTSDCGAPSDRLEMQWNVTEKMINVKHRMSELDLVAAKIYESILSLPHFKLNKETTDGVVSNNVKRTKQHRSQGEKKDRVKAMDMKRIKSPNIILKPNKSSLLHTLSIKEFPLLLDVMKQEGKMQEGEGKSGMKLTNLCTSLPSLSHSNSNSRTKAGKEMSGIPKDCLPPLKLQASSNIRRVSFAESINRESLSNVIKLKCLPQKNKEDRENIVDVKDIMGLICITLKGKKSPFKHLLHGKEPQRSSKKLEKMMREDKSNLDIVQNKLCASILSSPHLQWNPRIKEVYIREITRFCLPSSTFQELSDTVGKCEQAVGDIRSSIGKAKHIPENDKDRVEKALEKIMHSKRIALEVKQASVFQELNIKEKGEEIQENKQAEIWSKPFASISVLPHSKMDAIKGEEAMGMKMRSSFSQPNLQESSDIEKIAYEKYISDNISNSVKKTLEHILEKEQERLKTEKNLPLKKRKLSISQGIQLDIKEQEKKIENIKGESSVLLMNASTSIPSSHLQLDTRIEKAEYVTEVTRNYLPGLSHQKSTEAGKKADGVANENNVTTEVQKAKDYTQQKEENEVRISAKKDIMHPEDKGLKGKKALSQDLPLNPKEPKQMDQEAQEQGKEDREGEEQGKEDGKGAGQGRADRGDKQQGKIHHEVEEQQKADGVGIEHWKTDGHKSEKEAVLFLYLPSESSLTSYKLNTRIEGEEELQGIIKSATSQLRHRKSFDAGKKADGVANENNVTTEVQKAKDYTQQKEENEVRISAKKDIMHPEDKGLKGKKALSQDLPLNPKEPKQMDQEAQEQGKEDREGEEQGKEDGKGAGQGRADRGDKQQGKIHHEVEEQQKADGVGIEHWKTDGHKSEKEAVLFLYLPSESSLTSYKLNTRIEGEEELQGIIKSATSQLRHRKSFDAGKIAHTRSFGEDSSNDVKTLQEYKLQEEADGEKTVSMDPVRQPEGTIFEAEQLTLPHTLSIPGSGGSKTGEVPTNIKEKLRQVKERKSELEEVLTTPSLPHRELDKGTEGTKEKQGVTRAFPPPSWDTESSDTEKLKYTTSSLNYIAGDSQRTKYTAQIQKDKANTSEKSVLHPKYIIMKAEKSPTSRMLKAKELQVNISQQEEKAQEGEVEIVVLLSKTCPFVTSSTFLELDSIKEEGEPGIRRSCKPHLELQTSLPSGQTAPTKPIESLVKEGKHPLPQKECRVQTAFMHGVIHPNDAIFEAKTSAPAQVFSITEHSPPSKRKEPQWGMKERAGQKQERTGRSHVILTKTHPFMPSASHHGFSPSQLKIPVSSASEKNVSLPQSWFQESSDAGRIACPETIHEELSNDVKQLKVHLLQKEEKDRGEVADTTSVVDPNKMYLKAKKSPVLHTHSLSDLQWKTREQEEEKFQKVKSGPRVMWSKSPSRSSPLHFNMRTEFQEESKPILTRSSFPLVKLQESPDTEGGIDIRPIAGDVLIHLQKGKHVSQNKEEDEVQIVNIIIFPKHQEEKIQECEGEPGVVLTKSTSWPTLSQLELDKETHLDNEILRLKSSTLQRISHMGEIVRRESIVDDNSKDVKNEKQHIPQKEEREIDTRGTDITLKSKKSPRSCLLHRTELHVNIRGQGPKEDEGQDKPPGMIQRKKYASKLLPPNLKLERATQADEERLGGKTSGLLPLMPSALPDTEKTAAAEARSGDVRKGKAYRSQKENRHEVNTIEMRVRIHGQESRSSPISHILNAKELVLNINKLEKKVHKDKDEACVILPRTFLSVPSVPPLYVDSGNKIDKDTPGIEGPSGPQRNLRVPSNIQKITKRDSVEGDDKNIVKQAGQYVPHPEAEPQWTSNFKIGVQQRKEPSPVRSREYLSQLVLNSQDEDVYFTGFGNRRSGKRLEWLFTKKKAQPEKYKTETFTAFLSYPTMDATKMGGREEETEIMDNLNHKISPEVSVSLLRKISKELHITLGTLASSKGFSISERHAHQQETSLKVSPELAGSCTFDKPGEDVQSNDKISKIFSPKVLAPQTKGSLKKIDIVTNWNAPQNIEEQDIGMKNQVLRQLEHGHKIRPNTILSLKFPLRSGREKTPSETDVDQKTTAQPSLQILQILPGTHIDVTEIDTARGGKEQALLISEQEECVLELLPKSLFPPWTFPLQSGDLKEKDQTDTNTNVNVEQKQLEVDHGSAVNQKEGKLKIGTNRALHLEEDKTELHKGGTANLEKEKVRMDTSHSAHLHLPSLKAEESQVKTQVITHREKSRLIVQKQKNELEASNAKQNTQLQKLFQRNILDSFYSCVPLSSKRKDQKGRLTITDLKRELSTKYLTMKIQKHPIPQMLNITGCGTPSNGKKLESDVKLKNIVLWSKDISGVFIRSISISMLSSPHPDSETNLEREKGICLSKFQEKSPNTRDIFKRDSLTIVKGKRNLTSTAPQDPQPFVAAKQQMQKLPNVKSEANLRSEMNKKYLKSQTKGWVVLENDVSSVIKKPDLHIIEQEEMIPKCILTPTECPSMLEEPKLPKQRDQSEPLWDMTTQNVQQQNAFPGTVAIPPQVKSNEVKIVADSTNAEHLLPICEATKYISESHVKNMLQDKVSSDKLGNIQAYKPDDLELVPFPEVSHTTSTAKYPKMQHKPLLEQFTPKEKNKLTNHLESKAFEIQLKLMPEMAKKSLRMFNFYPKGTLSNDKCWKFYSRHKTMSFMSLEGIDTIEPNSKHKYQNNSPPTSNVKTLTVDVSSGSVETTKLQSIHKLESGTSSVTSASEMLLPHTLQNHSAKEKAKLLMHFSVKTLEIHMKAFPGIVRESHAMTSAQERKKPLSNCVHSGITRPKRQNRILLLFEEKSLHQIDLDLQYKYLRFLLGPPVGSTFPKPNVLPKHNKLNTVGICQKVDAGGESGSLPIDTELLEQHISFKRQSPHENSSLIRKLPEPTLVCESDRDLHSPRKKDTQALSHSEFHVTPEKNKQYHVWFQETNTYKSTHLRTQSNAVGSADSHETQISKDFIDIQTNIESPAELDKYPDLEVSESEECMFLEANSYLNQESQNILFELQTGMPLENPYKITSDLKSFYSDDSGSHCTRGYRKQTSFITPPSYKSHETRKYRSSSKMKSPDWLCHRSLNTMEIQSRSSGVSLSEEKLSWTTRSRTSYSLASLTESNIKLHLAKNQDKSHMHPERKERKKARFDLFKKKNSHWDHDYSCTHSKEKWARKKRVHDYESERLVCFQSKHKSTSKPHRDDINFDSERKQNRPFFFACVPADSLEVIPKTICWTIPPETLRKRNFRVPLVAKISSSWNIWSSSKKLLGSLSGSLTSVYHS